MAATHRQAPALTYVIHMPFCLFPRAERLKRKNKPPPSSNATYWGCSEPGTLLGASDIKTRHQCFGALQATGIQWGCFSTTAGRSGVSGGQVIPAHPGTLMALASPLSSARQGSRTVLTAWKGDPQRRHEPRQIVTAVGWEGITITFILH